MGDVVQLHARASTTSAGHKSGRSSVRDTPVSRSIGKTNSAGTPRLERVSQYQTCDCVVPMRSAKGFCPPAKSQARLSASVDIGAPYPNLGINQQRNLLGVQNLIFGTVEGMKKASAEALGERIRARRKKLGLSQPKLAKALGCPQQTINGWEHGSSGRPRLLLELSKVLCTTQEWLLREEGPEEVVTLVPKEHIAEAIQDLDPRLIPAALQYLRSLAEKNDEAA